MANHFFPRPPPPSQFPSHFQHSKDFTIYTLPCAETPAPIKPQAASYILERVFQLIMYPPLLNNILVALLAPSPPPSPTSATVRPWGPVKGGGAAPSCRQALLDLIETHAPLATPAAVRLLVAITQVGGSWYSAVGYVWAV